MKTVDRNEFQILYDQVQSLQDKVDSLEKSKTSEIDYKKHFMRAMSILRDIVVHAVGNEEYKSYSIPDYVFNDIKKEFTLLKEWESD